MGKANGAGGGHVASTNATINVQRTLLGRPEDTRRFLHTSRCSTGWQLPTVAGQCSDVRLFTQPGLATDRPPGSNRSFPLLCPVERRQPSHSGARVAHRQTPAHTPIAPERSPSTAGSVEH